MGERLSFIDSEDYSRSEAPPAHERGKAPVATVVHRRRRRHRQRRARVVGGFMADARCSHLADVVEVTPKVRSVVNHPAHTSSVPDTEGFHQVHSRRRWRWKQPARAPKPVPTDLVDLYFSCLGDNHVKADCRFPSRYRTYKHEGHRARNCPSSPIFAGAKRGRSPARSGSGRDLPCCRASPRRWHEDMVSARSSSTSRDP